MPRVTDLPTPEPANIAHTLAFADGGYQVDHFDAGIKRLRDAASLHRRDDLTNDRTGGAAGERTFVVDRLSQSAKHSTNQFRADRDAQLIRGRGDDRARA